MMMQNSFSIYEGITGSVVKYTVHFSYAINTTIPVSCTDAVCEYMVEVLPTVCQITSDHDVSKIDVSVSAANRLGSGKPSESDPIG